MSLLNVFKKNLTVPKTNFYRCLQRFFLFGLGAHFSEDAHGCWVDAERMLGERSADIRGRWEKLVSDGNATVTITLPNHKIHWLKKISFTRSSVGKICFWFFMCLFYFFFIFDTQHFLIIYKIVYTSESIEMSFWGLHTE